MRLVDADALKEGLKGKLYGHPFERTFLSGAIDSEPTIDAVPVVRCEKCVLHGNCVTEDAFVSVGIENPYCCAGEQEEGADNEP